MSSSTQYEQLLQAVEQYYGSGSDQWAEIAKYGIASDKAEQILRQVPGVNIVKNANGSVRSYNFKATENIASGAEQAVNSNTPAVIKSFEIPSVSGIENVTSPTGETVKQMTFKSGMNKAGNFVFGEVAPRVAAVAAGITLGKTVDKLLYEANPDFWDEHGMETLNPDKWGDIIGTDSSGARFANLILGTTPTGESQAYMDDNALSYMALYLQNLGLFSTGGGIEFNGNNIPDNISESIIKPWPNEVIAGNLSTGFTLNVYNNGSLVSTYTTHAKGNDVVYYIIVEGAKNGTRQYYNMYAFSKSNFSIITNDKTEPYKASQYVNNGGYVAYEPTIAYTDVKTTRNYDITPIKPYIMTGASNYGHNLSIYVMGDNVVNSVIDGIGNQEGSKTPDLSGANTPDEALDKLKEQYPDLWNNAVSQDVVQPDGTTKTYTYVPISLPEITPDGNPVSSTSTQEKPEITPNTDTEQLVELITKLIQRDPPTNPPDTGDGDTPVVPPVTGSASSLYAIYNPTLAQINSFGAWLWSDNFIEQIKKLFNDPMQAIIGLHKIYAKPIDGGTQNIKVGYLDSGVASLTVANQYTSIDCGTVQLSEQFHNVFDYSPYTDINLYLPFIGIVNLNVSDVMRSSIHIVYHVDVLSGACLAEVKIVRDSSGGTLYQYSGNASVTLPISSGSYMGIVSAVAGVAGGIAGTIASGGSALPLLASSAGAMFNAHTRVEHSGGFSGNAGAMGAKIPYLIISRPQTEMASGFENYIGYPSNFTAAIGSCTGFIKVIECHVENTTATNSELTEINTMLQEGVIV